jgi:hypothetical protein
MEKYTVVKVRRYVAQRIHGGVISFRAKQLQLCRAELFQNCQSCLKIAITEEE